MSLPVLASDPGQIEQAADPAAFVVLACERAKTWLAQALEHGDIDQIVELKSQADAIRVYTAQKQIGKDAELAAAEIVRRAERGLGVAIRRGQASGEIVRPNEGSAVPAGEYTRVRNGKVEHLTYRQPRLRDPNRRSPREFFASADDWHKTYAVTDGVSTEEYEAALSAAKAEGNLSRANVLRKTRAIKEAHPEWDLATAAGRRDAIREMAERGYASRQIAPMVGMVEQSVRDAARDAGIDIPADKTMHRSRRPDPNRIVEETAHALEGLCLGLELVDFERLDRTQTPHWSGSLRTSLRSLNRFLKELDQ